MPFKNSLLQDGSIVRMKEVSDPSLSIFELLGKVKVLTPVCLQGQSAKRIFQLNG